MLYALYKSIFAPLEVINRNEVKGRIHASVVTVLATAIFGSVIAPIIYFCANKSRHDISLDIGGMFTGVSVSIVIWIAVCVLLWLLSKAFRKGLGFGLMASTWGLSYIPNLLCIVLYNLLLNIPGIYNGSGVFAFIFSTLFIILLVWKAIYYFMFLRFVIDTTLGEFVAITAISAVVFAALIILGSKVGIQVPMI